MADDAARLGAMMRRHITAAIEAAKVQARKEGETLVGVMRATAPRDELDLIKSIRVEDATERKTSKSGSVAFVGVVVKAGDEATIVTNSRGQRFQNAKLQEHGTKRMRAPNPYFNPSYRRRRSQIRANISRALRRGWLRG